MDFGITIMLVGVVCFAIGLLNFKYSVKKMEANPDYNPNDEGCFGTFFTYLLVIGAILLFLGMMMVSSSTGGGDPSFAPNWRGN